VRKRERESVCVSERVSEGEQEIDRNKESEREMEIKKIG
jgi:hypothetical protein